MSQNKLKRNAHVVAPTQNILKILYVNARSLRNKFEDMEEVVFSENYDVIGITETWLNLENRDFLAEYKLPGYTIFEKSRTDKKGGGTLLYVKEHLKPVQLTKPQIPNVDSLYVLLKDNLGKKIVIGLIYRPPAQNVQTNREIYEQSSEICNTEDTVLMGDFNLPVPK